MNKTWVLIDLSYLAYRALYSVGHLTYDDGPTGVLFGFFTQLKQICQDHRVQSNKIALFFDSRKSYRAETYPPYKEKRKSNRSQEDKEQVSILYHQVELLKTQILPDMGLKIYQQEGLESDDLMALAAERLSIHKKRAVIVTGDGDLFQCISRHVHWFDAGRNVYHSPATFKDAKGIHPKYWGQVKALAGCHSDNVAGIPGVGEKTAIQYLNGVLAPTRKTFQSIESSKGQRIAKRNEELVLLPHKRTRPVGLSPPAYNAKEFFRTCTKYGLSKFLANKKDWINFFKGIHGPVTRMRGE